MEKEEENNFLNNGKEFKKEEVVWAKVKNYPYWPAIITKIRVCKDYLKYNCHFFGDNTYEWLTDENIKKFKKYYEKLSKTCNEHLKRSINEALEFK